MKLGKTVNTARQLWQRVRQMGMGFLLVLTILATDVFVERGAYSDLYRGSRACVVLGKVVLGAVLGVVRARVCAPLIAPAPNNLLWWVRNEQLPCGFDISAISVMVHSPRF
jgi:hypothetical protein